MLVLSRKRDEKIVIADSIVITIVEIRGDKVRLGIEAPPHIPVHRQEVYSAIMKHSADLGPPSTADGSGRNSPEPARSDADGGPNLGSGPITGVSPSP